ncbi:hypothetical protein PINS_up020385 [Pythium insidiosum]|nr:hypothetical protein PINS_up020385 [Pythium insidiosum]
MADAAARMAPVARIAREDIRSTLHTHFRAQAVKQLRSTGQAAATPATATATAATVRRRVYSFIQVQKKKLSLGTKRLFAHGGSVSKSYILCVTVQDAGPATPSVAQLHYLQFLSTLNVDVRQTWDVGRLEVVEHNGVTSERKRGAFSLFFRDEDSPWQWLVDETEARTAMEEFIWSLCALAADQRRPLPKLVRISVEELNELAIHQNFAKRYGIDIDLLDHMAAMKKKALSTNDDPTLGATGTATGDSKNNAGDADPTKRGANGKPGVSSVAATAQRLTAAENEDAEALLAGVNWNDVQLQTVEEDLKRRLRVLEDENITFLLSFEGDNNKSAAVQPIKAHGDKQSGHFKGWGNKCW